MTRLKRVVAPTLCMLVAFAAVARADQWNDRTKLTFDAPIMIPGATLGPGTYTFKLLDNKTSRQIVQVFNEDETKLIATTQAVPTKRMEPRGEVVLKFNPTKAGAPAALKAWFYPGSLYGHEFIYPENQARDIAQRTKTLVLSGDAAGTDSGSGSLHTYDADGRTAAWQADPHVIKEWNDWQKRGASAATIAAPGTRGNRESTAPMMRAQPEGLKVSVGDLEEHPTRYVGQTINVTGEVDDVFGPRLFKIDEPDWADLDGEILVFLPGNLAALVRENDRVTVTGTMKQFPQAQVDRELAWLDSTPHDNARLAKRPILMASRVVGGNSDVAVSIDLRGRTPETSGAEDKAEHGSKPVATSGTTAPRPDSTALTDAAALGRGDSELVGRHVQLNAVKISRAGQQGFWIDTGGRSVFVLPAERARQTTPAAGQSVAITGVVLEMPRSLRDKTRAAGTGNENIYLYATIVK